MLTTYVDDILAGAPKVQLSNLWAAVRERFGTTPAEEPRRYLGAQLFRGLWAKSAGGRGTAKLFISMLEYSEKAIGDYKSESGRQVYAQSCAMTQTVMEDLLFLKAAQEHKKTLEKSLAAGKGAGRPPPDMPYLAHERSERPLVEKREGSKASSAKNKKSLEPGNPSRAQMNRVQMHLGKLYFEVFYKLDGENTGDLEQAKDLLTAANTTTFWIRDRNGNADKAWFKEVRTPLSEIQRLINDQHAAGPE